MAKEKTFPSYSVKAACRRLGIGPHTLRAWEARYGAVEPSRTPTGQRRYTVNDVERLECIIHLLNVGHSVGEIAKLPTKELHRLLQNSQAGGAAAFESSMGPLISLLEKDLKKFEVNSISSLLDQKRIALGARGFVLDVLAPVLRWMGGQILKNELSIAHEHALSAVVRDQIYQTLRYGSAPITDKSGPRFVLAAPEDDLHEFGILMAATLLSHYGMSSHFLGANLPAEALAIGVKGVRGNVVILGNAPVPDSERRISFDKYLEEVHSLIPKHVAIWIGGSGKLPHLRSVLSGREFRFIGSLQELDELIAKTRSRESKGN